jgi:hypothetical protein
MIRLDYYVRRKPELEQEDFQAQWLQEHGRLWVKHAEALGVRRYTQVHDWPDHPVCEAWRTGYGVQGQPYDGVSTAYWPSYRVLVDAMATVEGLAGMADILAHEKRIIDTPKCILSFGIVHPVLNPRGKVVASEETDVFRCMYFPEGLPQFSVEKIQRHWIAVHAWLTHEYSASSPNKRYFQVHAVEYPIAEDMRAARGIVHNLRHFGHAEAWSCQEEFQQAANNPRRQELLPMFLADIDAFCDKNRGYFLAGKEFHLVDDEMYTLPLPTPNDFWA